MANEDLILEKIEKLENRIDPIVKSANSMAELKEDFTPLTNNAVQLLIKELEGMEAAFDLDDLVLLLKKALRNTRNFIFLLRQLDSIIEFARDLEPLLKSAIPQLIHYLDELERKGVFRIIRAMMDVRAKVAAAYSPEDIDQIGDTLVAMLGLVKRVSDENSMEFIERIAGVPAAIDLEKAKKIGPFGLASAACNHEVKEGLGVMIELTKAMGRLKHNGNSDVKPGSN